MKMSAAFHSVLDTMRHRCSVRAFLSRPVEEAKLQQVLEAAHVAPSAANRQSSRVLVIQSPERLALFRSLCRFREPPVVLVVCSVDAEAWVRSSDGFNAGLVDASIVCDHMMLVAADLGLGSLWMSAFDVPGVQRAFDLPAQWVPRHLLCLGYADGSPLSPDRFADARKPHAETIFREFV